MIHIADFLNLQLPQTPQDLTEPVYTRFQEIYRAFQLIKDYLQARDGIYIHTAFNNIPAFSFVALHIGIDGKTIEVFPASALSVSERAFGFCVAPIKIGAPGLVDFSSNIQSGFTNLFPGSVYYLGVTPGSISLTYPTAPSTIRQEVGFAVTDKDLFVKLSVPIVNT